MGFEGNFSKLVDCKIVVNIKRDPIDGKGFLILFFYDFRWKDLPFFFIFNSKHSKLTLDR
jgi:hypothetical protein